MSKLDSSMGPLCPADKTTLSKNTGETALDNITVEVTLGKTTVEVTPSLYEGHCRRNWN